MPRHFNRKVEIRFDDSSLEQIDITANRLGLSRAEFVRCAATGTLQNGDTAEAPSSLVRSPLGTDEYLSLVQHTYRALGGNISRIHVETCVAVVLKRLLDLSCLPQTAGAA
jgi:hypothetical protein